jgi:hypothetical protein
VKRVLLALVSSSLACARPQLLREADGALRPAGRPYAIELLSDGRLMPAGWQLDNYEKTESGLRLRERDDRSDFLFSHVLDDAKIVILTRDLSRHQREESMVQLVNELLGEMRSWHLYRTAGGIWNSVMGFQFLEVRPANAVAKAGAEAIDLVADMAQRAVAGPLGRAYFLWARTADKERVTILFYVSSPLGFEDGYVDVKDLVRRLVFR